MDTNKKVLIGAIGAAVVIGGAAIGFVLSRTPEKADLSSIHTEAAAETQKATMAAPKETETTASVPEETKKEENASSNITTKMETYTSGKISIQYPVISDLGDEAKEKEVNRLLKNNALSVISANSLNEEKDSLEIKCKIVSADRKRIAAVYTGSLLTDGGAYPTSMFYTNTVNISQAQNMGLGDYTDAYTMAGYVLSDDVEFSGLSSEMEAQVLEYRSNLDIDILTEVFDGADFPLASEEAWPESFSYENQGVIYFSLPLPHALGDYAIVTFNPSTK
jgi:hypothetical protein